MGDPTNTLFWVVMARHPGTPVGDLFPPGVAIFGAGVGQGQQALPPASSHNGHFQGYLMSRDWFTLWRLHF